MYVARCRTGVASRRSCCGRAPGRRQGQNRTLANLSRWLGGQGRRAGLVLEGPAAGGGPEGRLRSPQPAARPCGRGAGHAAGAGVEELIDPVWSRQQDLVPAMVVAQVIDPASEAAVAPGCAPRPPPAHWACCWVSPAATRTSRHAAMDWLAPTRAVEDALAAPSTWPGAPGPLRAAIYGWCWSATAA